MDKNYFDIFHNNFKTVLARSASPYENFTEIEDLIVWLKDIIETDLKFIPNKDRTAILSNLEERIANLLPLRIVEDDEIGEVLKKYDISYYFLLNESGDNRLSEILSNGVLTEFSEEELEIRQLFNDFWLNQNLQGLLRHLRELQVEAKTTSNKKAGKKLDVIEKLMIIHLLQESNLFPKYDNENTTQTAVCKLIAALTDISNWNEVYKSFKDQINPIYKKQLATKQIPHKIRNFEAIRPIIDGLKNESLKIKLTNLEIAIKKITTVNFEGTQTPPYSGISLKNCAILNEMIWLQLLFHCWTKKKLSF